MLLRRTAPVTSFLVGNVACFRIPSTVIRGTATMSNSDSDLSSGFKWHRSMLRCKVGPCLSDRGRDWLFRLAKLWT